MAHNSMNHSIIQISLTSPFSRRCIRTSSFASDNLLFTFANCWLKIPKRRKFLLMSDERYTWLSMLSQDQHWSIEDDSHLFPTSNIELLKCRCSPKCDYLLNKEEIDPTEWNIQENTDIVQRYHCIHFLVDCVLLTDEIYLTSNRV